MKSHMQKLLWILAFCSPLLSSHAQDLFDDKVLEIHIEFEEAKWRDILLQARKNNDNKRLNAQVTIDGVVYPDVQVRFKGNSSFHGAVKAGYRKIPFNMKASDDFPFAGGYETLKLANNYRDPSCVREQLGYRIVSDYLPVPRSTAAAVYVNDEYLGVYTATEGIDNRMATRFYKGNKRRLVQAEPDFDGAQVAGCPKGDFANLEYLGEFPVCYSRFYEVRDTNEWQSLIRLTRVLHDSVEIIEDVLDVHSVLWMHALNNVLVNLDSYLGFFAHNYYLYRDSADIYHPLMWDMNLAFGGFNALKEGADIDLPLLSPIVHDRYRLYDRPLIWNLLQEKLYRQLYFSMIRTLLDDWLLQGRYAEVAQTLQSELVPYIQKEQGTFFSARDFNENLYSTVHSSVRSIPGIIELMDQRTDYLDKHPLIGPNTLVVDSWYVSDSPDSTIIRVHTTGGVKAVRLWYRLQTRDAFHPVKMVPLPVTSEFECRVAKRPEAFYLELEGETSANLWPDNAPKGVLTPTGGGTD